MAKKVITKNLGDLTPEPSSQRMLLEEYRLLHSRFLNLRDEGVTRVNFFITAASVALGGVLVFGSGSNNMPTIYFKLILLATLTILVIVGLEIYNSLVYRDIATDRYERGMARIRHYFIRLDPNIEDYFVNKVDDIPTNYLIRKNSGMRRVTQIIESFFLGLTLTILSTFIFVAPEVDIAIGLGTTILVFLILEINARRKLGDALESVKKEIKFKGKVNAK